jgi:MerR family transcriptional regulator/heat shock protein HspR
MPPLDYDTPIYSIGTAAKMLSVSVQTLRLYEQEGLIISFKTAGKQRLYSSEDIDRLKCIRKMINHDKISIGGMKQIHGMIPCWEIIKCSVEERTNCAAFKKHTGGCWTYEHTHSTCATKECRLCPVYKLSSNCEQIKQLIVQSSFPLQPEPE